MTEIKNYFQEPCSLGFPITRAIVFEGVGASKAEVFCDSCKVYRGGF